MAGVRIQHPTERNVTFTLVDGARPYTEPFECPSCHRTHQFKTYHFALDETGSALVSLTIWDRLQRIASQPFVLANEVKRPPNQTLNVTPLLKRGEPIAP